MAKTNHDSGSARRALNEPINEDTEDVVGDRTRLIEIGMAAVFLACVLFAIARFVMAELSGLRTPWWGNALAASMVALIYAWFRRDPVGRSTIAVHVTAFAATVAMLIPSAYGMSASKWWLSLVGFSAVLMARRREALVWSTVTVVLMPIVAMLEPHILIVGAIGEPPIELALSTFFYVVLLLGLTLAFRRVADRRALALSQTAVSLERANRVRNNFLAHMSHELRTPLHGVIAMSDLASSGEASATVHEQVRAARQSAQVLLSLLNNILDVTRAESNGIELNVTESSLHTTLSEVLRPLGSQAVAKGLVFQAIAEPGLEAIRAFDRVRLGQVVTNLANNALKFTEAGAITVRVRRDAHDPNGVHIAVEDTGRGIPEDKLEAIFEPFTQTRSSDTQNQSGAGLGLSIVRELVRAMDGTIAVSSRLGQGTTFTISLRLPISARDTEGPEDLLARTTMEPEVTRIVRAPMRVLVCEDDPVAQRVARAMFERDAHATTIVGDGMSAWEAVRRDDFALLMTDVEVAGLDGLELTRRIRERERDESRPRLPIIAATAHVGEADQHRLFAAGVDAHLPKPFTVAELTSAIERAVQMANQAA